jgi:glycosyltransferase involved in cell wall biosynthesis
MPSVAVCFGTFNRLALLVKCIESVRRSVGALEYKLYIADGGSSDGTLEYLRTQEDVVLIEQGELLGAVKAFNAAIERAVDDGCRWFAILNDDIHFVGPQNEIAAAVAILAQNDCVGMVAFNSDRYGEWRFERFHGVAYGNQGVVRLETLQAVARAQGDPDGKAWWDRSHHTYASDTIAGCWTWRLGWSIIEAHDLKVHDGYTSERGDRDPLRLRNFEHYGDSGDRFNRQWGAADSIAYHRDDAERFGGRLP